MSKIRLSNDVGIYGLLDMDLLWTNSSPKSDFSAKTITLNGLSNYSLIVVDYAFSKDFTIRQCLVFTPTTQQLRFIGVIANRLVLRLANISGNSMSFNNGQQVTTYNGAATDDNQVIIPYQIYGIK